MNRTPSELYIDYQDNTVSVLKENIEAGLHAGNFKSSIPIYFRADDIGVPSHSFKELLRIFSCCNMPLCLAVVPAWLSAPRWAVIADQCEVSSPNWCWHQHGWTHRNHQHTGKKCEFGSERHPEAIKKDIIRGRDRLREIMGHHFTPVFTPPWNRCTEDTLPVLRDAGFVAVSRDSGSKQYTGTQLPDLRVNVDLHTRREPDGRSCLAGLAQDLYDAAETGRIGMMIHHQRMNKKAFQMLEALLQAVSANNTLTPTHFGHMH